MTDWMIHNKTLLTGKVGPDKQQKKEDKKKRKRAIVTGKKLFAQIFLVHVDSGLIVIRSVC
jgi:hypothetical protein